MMSQMACALLLAACLSIVYALHNDDTSLLWNTGNMEFTNVSADTFQNPSRPTGCEETPESYTAVSRDTIVCLNNLPGLRFDDTSSTKSDFYFTRKNKALADGAHLTLGKAPGDGALFTCAVDGDVQYPSERKVHHFPAQKIVGRRDVRTVDWIHHCCMKAEVEMYDLLGYASECLDTY